MDLTDYVVLRSFCASALGARLTGRPHPPCDLDRATALMRETLTAPEYAGAELLACAAALGPWPKTAEWPEPTESEIGRVAARARVAAARLAAHLPEREAAELSRAVAQVMPEPEKTSLPSEPEPRAPGRWTGALAGAFEAAEQNAANSTEWRSVWAALVALAQQPGRPAPLLGYVEDEGIKYQTYNEAKPVDFLTREAFRKRYARAADADR